VVPVEPGQVIDQHEREDDRHRRLQYLRSTARCRASRNTTFAAGGASPARPCRISARSSRATSSAASAREEAETGRALTTAGTGLADVALRMKEREDADVVMRAETT
jgi:hypothetical protein